jgi:hypothetical protein
LSARKPYAMSQRTSDSQKLRLANGLSRTQRRGSWSRLMPQACERNESVRHGIVAIAALDLRCELNLSQRLNPRDGGLDPNARHEFALQQYSLALRHM